MSDTKVLPRRATDPLKMDHRHFAELFKQFGKLAVGDFEPAAESLLFEIGTSERDGRVRQVDAGDVGASFREPRQVDSGPASHFENVFPPAAVEWHELEQMMELLEMIVIEVVEEAARSNRMFRDLEIVNVMVPVGADLVCCGHARDTIAVKNAS